MNLLLLDTQHCFLAYALRCMAAGHHVKICMSMDEHTGQRVKTGDGLVEKIQADNWKTHMAWADLVMLSDNGKLVRELEAYKRKGFPVLAPSSASADLELDRKKGQAFFEAHGVKTVPYQAFSDAKKAEGYVRSKMERFVCKPNNNQARELSYCAKTPADMILMLRRWNDLGSIKGEFLLQEFVDGIEVGVAGWLGTQGFCGYFEEFFEHKRLMVDDLGANTGETGTALKYVAKSDSQLAKELLLPLERDLIKLGHLGSVAVGVMVDEDGEPRPLEFTMRFGWPSFNIVQSLHTEPCEWLARLVDGEDTFRPLLDHAVGVVVTQAPFPYEEFIHECGGKVKKQTEGIPLYGLDAKNAHHISPCDVMEGLAPAMVDGDVVDKRLLVSTGDYLAVCTGIGDTVSEAKDAAYAAVDSMDIPNSVGYRTDIGDRLRHDLPKLQEVGFASTWEY